MCQVQYIPFGPLASKLAQDPIAVHRWLLARKKPMPIQAIVEYSAAFTVPGTIDLQLIRTFTFNSFYYFL